jgi:hypothetical protein
MSEAEVSFVSRALTDCYQPRAIGQDEHPPLFPRPGPRSFSCGRSLLYYRRLVACFCDSGARGKKYFP